MKSSNETMTREEAIAVIRKNYPHVGFSGTEFETALRELIPELAESGEERIRKAIIDALNSHCNSINLLSSRGYSMDDVISYLKKQKKPENVSATTMAPSCWAEEPSLQKEQKPISFNEPFNPDDYEMVMEGDATGLKRKEQKPEGVYVDCTEHPDWYGMPQKTTTKVNGEPIPTENTAVDIPCTEWSEEDNIGWDEAFACVIRAEKSAKNEEELQNAVTAEKWLKEIKFKYYVNPNKQEWSGEEALNRTYEEGFNDGLKYRKPVKRSDEDKKMSDWLIGLVNANIELSFKDKVNLTRWLEHLTIEKELPKNDKRIIDAIMIGYQDKDFSSSQIPTPIGVSKDEVIDWLKSLRPQPHWKPSGEQMKALDTYRKVPCSGSIDRKVLDSLYNSLEKMM